MAMTEIGQLKVKLTLDAEPFKAVLGEVTDAVQALEAAIAKLHATSIGVSVDG
jgi:hypothetical protein